MRRILRRLSAAPARRGAAALEFVIVMPILALIMVTAADLGNAAQQSIRLETAARAGAQYAFSFPTDVAGIRRQVLSAVADWTDVTVPNPTVVCRCGTTTYSCTTQVTCSGAVNSTDWTEIYVSIRISRPFDALLVPNLSPLEGRAEVRVR
jgi:Flp pilus assembly protein TadG